MQTSVKFWSVLSIRMALCAVPLRAEVLYMANTDGNSISAYHIEANGTLKQVSGSPFPSGKWPVSIKADPFGRFLFTSNMGDENIWTYRIGSDGTLTPLTVSSAGIMPYALAVDPFGRFLYVTNLDFEGVPEGGTVGHVSAFRVGINGTLRPVPGSPFPAGFASLCVVADPTGRFVYVGNSGYSNEEIYENVSGYRVGGNGTLIPLPGSPFRDGEAPQSMAVDPFGRFLYTAGYYDLALLTDRIAWNGTLTYLPLSSFLIGAGYDDYNAVVADRFGRFVYRSSLLGSNPADAILSVYRVGGNGLIFGSSYLPGFYSDSMVIDLSGQFLYAAETLVRGTYGPVHGNSVAAYRINGNGALLPVAGSPFLVGFSPDSMAVSP
jgi:6-phosphogluconolactonase (cycloisomerase 2 family)